MRDIVIICTVVAVLLGLSNAVPAAARADDWPGFRGVRGDGVAAANGVFSSEGVRLELAWKRPLGKGYSGISVAGGRAITMCSDGESDVVAAFDIADGRALWRYSVGGTYRGHDGSQDGPISTPFIDRERVFALGPRGVLVALDVATGRELWKTDLVGDHGAAKPHWGFGTSPRVAGGVLVVAIGAKDAMVCGFDPQTGKQLWAAGRDDVYYQSPVPLSGHDGPQLVAGNQKLLCVDPMSGSVLWEFAHDGGGEYGAVCMVPVALGDRRVFLDHKDDRSILIEVAADRPKPAIQTRWEARCFAKSYSVAVHHAGRLFGYNGRTSACVDAQTGKPLWRSRQPGDGFPIVVGDRLIIVTKQGSLHLARASGESYQEQASLKVFADLVWTPPSFANGSIFVRSFGELARIDVRRGTTPAPAPRDVGQEIAGTRLGVFIEELRAADDRPAAIDRFLAAAGPFPMIERDGRVVFVYRGTGSDLAVGGDLTGFGRKLPMQRVAGSDLFYALARLEPDARVSYAFVRDFQAIADPLNPRRTRESGFDEDLELSFSDAETELSWLAMPEWRPPTHLDASPESRRGRIESHNMHSTALEADVACDVYTPAGYEQMTERLPVAYIHGGQLARDSLRVPTALDNLIGRRIAPVIAVFVRHQPPFFAAEAYARMSALELPAFVDAKYRTIRSREARAHLGWGFGGYAALYSVLAHADQCDKVGVQSPFLLQLSYIEPAMKKAADTPLTVYIGWGKYDTRSPLEFWSVAEMARRLDEYFRAHGYRPVGGEAHEGGGVASWQNRTDDLLEALFPPRGR